jgi:hypothetical protein
MSELGGHSRAMGCEQERARLVELALGILSGAERADLVDHVGHCGACRAELSELVQVADLLVQAVPEDEPPAGFEAAVLARLPLDERPEEARSTESGGSSGAAPGASGRAVRSRARSWRGRPLLLGAAALFVVLGAGFVLGRGTTKAPPVPSALGAEYAHTLRTLGGRALLAGQLRAPDGHRVGEAFLYEGVHPWPSWLFVQVASADPPGRERVVVMDASGQVLVRLSDLRYEGGIGSWGRAVHLPSHLQLPLRVDVIWSTGGVSSGTVAG